MDLSKQNLSNIRTPGVYVPSMEMFDLPEKILQFGTGVLLRALPDYFVEKANRKALFGGRILVVKSTDSGDTEAFDLQDGLYTLAIRGIQGIALDHQMICSSISRVLSAKKHWKEILKAATSEHMHIVISNTTEVGIQLTKESIFNGVPESFPAKLLAFLYERFVFFAGSPAAGMVIVPTELITDNGIKLKDILVELAEFNQLPVSFIEWLKSHNHFCNSLVDRIVPGKPSENVREELEKQWGYKDQLATICEPYHLWAIEGNEYIRSVLSFYAADESMTITTDITRFKELKLRMLNATHTLCCGLAWLSGFKTVKSSMTDIVFESYVKNVMLNEIGQAIPYDIGESDVRSYGNKVLDRFRNPFLEHRWLSITMQYSSKIVMRVLPVLHTYYAKFKKTPELISMGFAAYILFMRPVKKDSEVYFGLLDNEYYQINDDYAAEFFGLWDERTVDQVVEIVLSNTEIWKEDLTRLENFSTSVTRKLKGFIRNGTMLEIASHIHP